MMRRHYLAVILIASATFAARGQVGTTELLAPVLSDQRLSMTLAFQDRFRAADMGISLVDKTEVRGRTRRFATMRHDLILRTSFNSFGESRALRNRHLAQADIKSLDWLQLRSALLEERYYLLLDMLQAEQKLVHEQEMLRHHVRLDSIYLRLLAAGEDADLGKYIKNKEDIVLTRLRVDELQEKRAFASQRLGRDTAVALPLEDLISPERMAELVRDIQPAFQRTMDMRSFELKNRYLDASVQLLNVQNTRFLDFVEGRYTIRNDLFFEDRFSIGVGLMAPWRGSSRHKKQSLLLQKEELLLDNRLQETQFQWAYQQARADFDRQYALYNAYAATLNDEEIARLRQIIRGSGRMSILEMEQLHRSEVDIRYRLWEHYMELMHTWLRILKVTETLTTPPLRDYLHEMTPLLPEE
jgi:hypothetical protein